MIIIVFHVLFQSTADKYALHIQKWMKPFLSRCENVRAGAYNELVSQYLVDTAVEDLQLVFKVFECSKANQPVCVHNS